MAHVSRDLLELEAFRLTKRLAFPYDRAAPVHHRAEDIECERFDPPGIEHGERPYRDRGPDGFAGVAGLSLSCTTRSLSRRTSSS